MQPHGVTLGWPLTWALSEYFLMSQWMHISPQRKFKSSKIYMDCCTGSLYLFFPHCALSIDSYTSMNK